MLCDPEFYERTGGVLAKGWHQAQPKLIFQQKYANCDDWYIPDQMKDRLHNPLIVGKVLFGANPY